jgi:CspA family cold shock protein
MRRLDVPSGTVKWFKLDKGYGFIAPESGGNDIFVHITAVKRSGLGELQPGDKVSFELVESRGRKVAENLHVL